MSTLIVYEYITLDGVIEAPEQWQFPYLSPDVAQMIQAQMMEADAILLGRMTYEIFAASWPKRTHNEFGVADQLNRVSKFVVSTTLDHLAWNNSTLINAHAVEEIALLKHKVPGTIVAIGSAGLVQTLMQHALVDEYRLLLHPLVLGGGKRLFSPGIQQSLKLVACQGFDSGAVLLCYQPEGRPILAHPRDQPAQSHSD